MYVLNIYFPIEEILQSKYYSQKPFDYISNLIGHEGPGSILSFLKKNGNFSRQKLYRLYMKTSPP